MANIVEEGPIETLSALLDTARSLAQTLLGDEALQRGLRALAALSPEDREILTTALVHAVGWRRVNESIASASSVHLRANPNPRLFVRVVDPEKPVATLTDDQDEVQLGTLRIMRRVWLLNCPEARKLWVPAVREGYAELSAAEQEACLEFATFLSGLVSSLVAERDSNAA